MKKKAMMRFCLVLLCVGLSLCMFSGCSSSRVTKETEEMTFGIDVSKYQGTINWQEAAQSGIDFAIVRIGYRTGSDGTIKEDNNGRYNLQEGSKAGIAMGVYFYSTAISEDEAEEEAKWVAEIIKKYPITYPVVYDCEGFRNPENRHHSITNEKRTDIALAFLEAIEKQGYEGMFYGAKNELTAFWDIERIEEEYKIWVAQYPLEPYPTTPQSSYERPHQMWQYTQEGTAAGIDYDVDQNVAYFGYDGIEPPKDKEAPAEVGPDPEALMVFKEVYEQVTAKVETNLRNMPSQDESSQILYTLKNGEVAERIGISDSGWSKVRFEGKIYYAKSSYLTTDMNYDPESGSSDPEGGDAGAGDDGIQTQFQDADLLVTAKEHVNLREKPGVAQKDVGDLYHGDIAVCTGISDNGWARLEYQGITCYAVYRYLEPYISSSGDGQNVGMDFAAVNEKVTPTKTVKLRTVPNTSSEKSVVIQVENGDVFYRIGINKALGWSKIIYHGQTLYCSSALLTVVTD